jgi:hypothetical protein
LGGEQDVDARSGQRRLAGRFGEDEKRLLAYLFEIGDGRIRIDADPAGALLRWPIAVGRRLGR